jgi:hypothetical protein
MTSENRTETPIPNLVTCWVCKGLVPEGATVCLPGVGTQCADRSACKAPRPNEAEPTLYLPEAHALIEEHEIECTVGAIRALQAAYRMGANHRGESPSAAVETVQRVARETVRHLAEQNDALRKVAEQARKVKALYHHVGLNHVSAQIAFADLMTMLDAAPCASTPKEKGHEDARDVCEESDDAVRAARGDRAPGDGRPGAHGQPVDRGAGDCARGVGPGATDLTPGGVTVPRTGGDEPVEAWQANTIELPISPTEDKVITCMYCRRETPCQYEVTVLRRGETAIMGVHAECIEPLRRRNPRKASVAVPSSSEDPGGILGHIREAIERARADAEAKTRDNTLEWAARECDAQADGAAECGRNDIATEIRVMAAHLRQARSTHPKGQR